jgi:hypothetical protein
VGLARHPGGFNKAPNKRGLDGGNEKSASIG